MEIEYKNKKGEIKWKIFIEKIKAMLIYLNHMPCN
jgi:hypothetical protein